ncbi:hypothetical protein C8F04DRAFT_1316557 [Mycena alexandri]|uniref:Ubiquitin-like protease family profile domain-containing protein n=1 Tax=Mycena alexandri TaxID=1745969 RepID=A0AAD6WPW5_9AGAR|nr:hypothetical protein C8F04DRAFT_1316557 [Mycena alexandri]
MAPLPKPPKPRGRPSKKRRKPTNPSATDPPLLVPPDSPLPLDDPASPGDPERGVALVGDDARYALLAAQSANRMPEGVAAGNAATQRLFLNVVPHEVEQRWKLVANMRTEDLPSWFDDLLNDFHVHDMSPNQDVPSQTLAVIVKWIGHPGSSPRDPRSRQFFIRWNDPPPPQALVDQAIARKQPVVRWDLRCAGVHDLDFSDPPLDEVPKEPTIEPSGGAPDNSNDDSSSDSQDMPVEPKAARWKVCSTLVKLHVEVYANDLSSASVWQQNEHPDVPLADRAHGLQFSRVQRSIFLENLRLHGLKVSSLVLQMMHLSPSAYGRATPLPSWREAKPKELQSMYAAVKQRQLLDKNPWRATHLLVRANKDKIFGYIPHNFERPDSESEFAIGLTDNYSLQSAVAYTADGGVVGSDACWRNKSQNRAAMSLLCTVDEGEHMVPISIFLSANVKIPTLLSFFVGTYEKIVMHAKEITADPKIIITRNRSPEVIERIEINAKKIAVDGWCMGKFMIDKHYPSLRAIQEFCKKYNITVYIRLCQFHVVRAILYWEWGDGRKGLAIAIPKSIKFEIVWLFRFVQRARTRKEFHALTAKFLEAVEALIMNEIKVNEADEEDADEGAEEKVEDGVQKKKKGRRTRGRSQQKLRSMYEAVKEYFERCWFVDDWIDTYTDIGLPPNQGRDGTWNTNNWTERGFKTFDSYWRPADRQPPPEMIELHRTAYTLWDRGAVRQLGTDRYETQSGKPCLHILAVRLFISNGPVEEWMKVEAASEKAVPKRDSKEAKRKKVKSDEAEEQELYDIFEKLEEARNKEEEDRVSASPEPVFAPQEKQEKLTGFGAAAAMGKSPGRPANSKPLVPGRTPSKSSPTHEPTFSRRSGRPPAGRLAQNSLFPASLKNSPARKSSGRLEAAAGFLTAEELEMNTANVTRWSSPQYRLRAEEMDQWATILNYSEIAQRDGWLFISCSPTCFPPAVIAALDWSKPVTVAELRSQRLPILADIFEARPNIRLNFLVCFHLYEEHWTVFHHNLTGNHVEIQRVNPLRDPGTHVISTREDLLGFNIRDQVLLTSFLHPRRLSLLKDGVPSPKPHLLGTGFTQPYLGLQRGDSSTCGFWCILYAFSTLLDFNLNQHLVRDLNNEPAELKELLAPIYSAFRGDALGVEVDLVQQLFRKFNPTFDYSILSGTRFSLRPASISRAEEAAGPPHDTNSPPPASYTPANDITADPGLQHLIDPSLGDVTWLVGAHRPSSQNIRDFLEGKELHSVILDAYLDLVMQDIDASTSSTHKFLIVDSLIAQQMQEATKNGTSEAGMAPKSKARHITEYWFEDQDIFLLDWLILPWFWSLHWLVIGVDFKQTRISVYDSYKSRGGGPRAKAATERTLQMLRWEHWARYDNKLSANWKATPNLLDVPQQGQTVNCGLFALWFSKCLALGKTDVSQWSFSGEAIEVERLVVLNRLSAAIHADLQERNVDQLSRVGFIRPILLSSAERDDCMAEQRVFNTVYPILRSTDINRISSVDDFHAERLRRMNKPQIGECLLVPEGHKVYPAMVTKIIDTMILLDWFPGVYDKFPARKTIGFRVSPAEWREIISMTFDWQMLARIEWPAHLTLSPLFFPSPLFPGQKVLLDTLHPLLSEISALFFQPLDRPGSGVFAYLNTRFTHSPNRDHFYRNLLGTAPGEEPFSAGDEGLFNYLEEQLRETLGVIAGPLVAIDRNGGSRLLRQAGEQPAWIKGAARSMFATAAAAHYLRIDLSRALELLEARRVRRPLGPHEQALTAYAHAVREQGVFAAWEITQSVLVVVPGIAVSLPHEI